MEDFDNEELYDYDRKEQLRGAVEDYNAEYKTYYHPDGSVKNYEAWKKKKYQPEY